ncbi:hypothetical protein EV127DRAFT_169704 [Xylaria flabelliformis]|nr:hypothetical protein EV127DRAFT_169704 [Xylaria flabelliformis]
MKDRHLMYLHPCFLASGLSLGCQMSCEEVRETRFDLFNMALQYGLAHLGNAPLGQQLGRLESHDYTDRDIYLSEMTVDWDFRIWSVTGRPSHSPGLSGYKHRLLIACTSEPLTRGLSRYLLVDPKSIHQLK